MNNWLSGHSRYGSERRRGTRSAAKADPSPSFDETFNEARVCVIGEFLLIDCADGQRLVMNMRHCDQLLLGESSRMSPRRLTLRFRTEHLLPEQDDSDRGMVVVRVGLHDGYDQRAARDLHRHLVSRFSWLLETSAPVATDPRPSAETPEQPLPWHEEDAAEHAREDFGLASPECSTPREPSSGAAATVTDGTERWLSTKDGAASSPAGGRALLARETPVRGEPNGEWEGFVPGLRTRELYEEVWHRWREAEGR